MKPLVTPKHGRGQLNRGGRKKGSARLVTRTFQEISQQVLNDPDVLDALKRRVLLELAGKKKNPLPALAVLVAASEGRRAVVGDERGAVSFSVAIVAGRGVVTPTHAEVERAALPASTEEAAPAGQRAEGVEHVDE